MNIQHDLSEPEHVKILISKMKTELRILKSKNASWYETHNRNKLAYNINTLKDQLRMYITYLDGFGPDDDPDVEYYKTLMELCNNVLSKL